MRNLPCALVPATLIVLTLLALPMTGRAAPTDSATSQPDDGAATTRPTKVVNEWAELIRAYQRAGQMKAGIIQSIGRDSMTIALDRKSGGEQETLTFKLNPTTKVLVEVPANPPPRNVTVKNARVVRLDYGRPGDVRRNLRVNVAWDEVGEGDDATKRAVMIQLSPPGTVVIVGYPPMREPAEVPDVGESESPVKEVPNERRTGRPK
jgi:hypothetical protein